MPQLVSRHVQLTRHDPHNVLLSLRHGDGSVRATGTDNYKDLQHPESCRGLSLTAAPALFKHYHVRLPGTS